MQIESAESSKSDLDDILSASGKLNTTKTTKPKKATGTTPTKKPGFWSKIAFGSNTETSRKLRLKASIDAALRTSARRNQIRYDSEVYRIVILGAHGTGKTSLCSQLVGNGSVSSLRSASSTSTNIRESELYHSTELLRQSIPSAVVLSGDVVEDDNIITVTHNGAIKPTIIGSAVFETAAAEVPDAYELDNDLVKYAYKTPSGYPEFSLNQPARKEFEVYATRVSTRIHELRGLTALSGVTRRSGIDVRNKNEAAQRNVNLSEARLATADNYALQLVETPDDPFNEEMEIASGLIMNDLFSRISSWDYEIAETEEEAKENSQEVIHEAMSSLGVTTTKLQSKDARSGNDLDEEGKFGNLFLGYEFGTLLNPIARRDAKRETTDRENDKNFNPRNSLLMNCIAGGAIILYDIQKPKSLLRARRIASDIRKMAKKNEATATTPIMIVANFSEMVTSYEYDFGKDEDVVTAEGSFFAQGSMLRNRFLHEGRVHTAIQLVHRMCLTMRQAELFAVGPKKKFVGETSETWQAKGMATGKDDATSSDLDDDDLSVTKSMSESSAGPGRKDTSGLGWCW